MAMREMPADFFPEIMEVVLDFPDASAAIRYAEVTLCDFPGVWDWPGATLAVGYRLVETSNKSVGDLLLRQAVWQALEILRLKSSFDYLYPEHAQLRPRGAPPVISAKITDIAAGRPVGC